MKHEDKIKFMQEWCQKQKLTLVLEGEVGFGRQCVGVLSEQCGAYPDYIIFDEDYNIVGGDIDKGRKIKRDYFIGNYVHANYSDHSSIIRDFRENYEKITASVRGYIADIPTLRRPAHNLEVEDYHTYFVGEQGLWIHQ